MTTKKQNISERAYQLWQAVYKEEVDSEELAKIFFFNGKPYTFTAPESSEE